VGVGILVLISAILATARGLTREILSLATWAGSAAIAVYMWQKQPQIAEGFIADPMVAAVATIIVSFIVSLIVLHLLTMRIADFVGDSRIGPLDRTLGFVFGVLRGILIAIVLVIFGDWLLGASLPTWATEAKSLPYLRTWGGQLIAILPDDLENQVQQILQGGADGASESGPAEEPVPPADVSAAAEPSA
jgi:membrane protein required for colicin V production